jgi:2-amino-4-hydroxy-6-hydroxymethyldihydropteridine diphosphokinase
MSSAYTSLETIKGSNGWDDAVIVALGSNLAGGYLSSRDLLEAAVALFPSGGLNVRLRSRWWRSAAWPDRTAPDYLNGVVVVETGLNAQAVLTALLALESLFGRRRRAPNAPRTLDLDLIAHGREVIVQPGLILPHPRAAQRRFVMGPLAEIAPDWVHPVTGETAAALAALASVGADAAPTP